MCWILDDENTIYFDRYPSVLMTSLQELVLEVAEIQQFARSTFLTKGGSKSG